MAGEHSVPGTWTALVNAQAISDAGSNTSTAVSNDTKLGTEIGVTCAYGATATEGLKVYIAAEIDGTNYETVNDVPMFISLEYAVSATRYKRFWVPGSTGDFKIICTNDSGASVTVDVDYRQHTVATA